MLKMSRILCATKTSYTKPDLLCFGAFRVCFIHSLDHFSFIFSDGGPPGPEATAWKEDLRGRSQKVSSLYYSQIQNKQEQMKENIRDRIWKGHQLWLSLNSGRSSYST